VHEPGFTYLPNAFGASDATALTDYFATLHPLWENRHPDRRRGGTGRLTRPVYWLGAWQFAALGYYAEPDHVEHKCIRAEPLPDVLVRFLERMRPELARHGDDRLPNTALVNFYGRTPKGPGRPPVDFARLRMHRDAEPGPVVMLSLGQAAQFEFVDPDADMPLWSGWRRGRSAVVLSGPLYKDTLYHRVTQVRQGPSLPANVPDFDVRRISVSFRHVPEHAIHAVQDLPDAARDLVLPNVRLLAEHSEHFRDQLTFV
jgi:hypothetical protein